MARWRVAAELELAPGGNCPQALDPIKGDVKAIADTYLPSKPDYHHPLLTLHL